MFLDLPVSPACIMACESYMDMTIYAPIQAYDFVLFYHNILDKMDIFAIVAFVAPGLDRDAASPYNPGLTVAKEFRCVRFCFSF